jgi:hypothetical protein
MAKYKNFTDFVKDLNVKVINETFTKRQMTDYAQVAIEMIIKRTRQGYGVSGTGQGQQSLKRLSDGYIKYRRKNRFKLDSTTSPSKSNLTFTGQLLRSFTVYEVRNNYVSWGPNRKRRKGGITNQELGEFVSEERPFNYLSKSEIEKIRLYADKVLQSNARKL